MFIQVILCQYYSSKNLQVDHGLCIVIAKTHLALTNVLRVGGSTSGTARS